MVVGLIPACDNMCSALGTYPDYDISYWKGCKTHKYYLLPFKSSFVFVKVMILIYLYDRGIFV